MLFEFGAFLGGVIIGSFLNACIYRIPRGISVISPGSQCPRCQRPIGPLENIPVLSYVLQAGKCRGCGGAISPVYPIVEILTGILFLLLYLQYGFHAPFFLNAYFFSLLVALMFIDLFERILPDKLTLTGMMMAFFFSPLQDPALLLGPGSVGLSSPILAAYVNSALGAGVAGGILWAVGWFYLRLRKIEGLGFGDVKLMGMVGAFLGWQYAWLTILLGSLTGALIGGGYMLLTGHGRRYELPFGTFLGGAAILVALWGPTALAWYLDLVQ